MCIHPYMCMYKKRISVTEKCRVQRYHSSAIANGHWFLCLLSTEVPPSPPPPNIVEVYEDGVQVVWKPVETNTPVHYTVQCKSEGKVECCPYALQGTSRFVQSLHQLDILFLFRNSLILAP